MKPRGKTQKTWEENMIFLIPDPNNPTLATRTHPYLKAVQDNEASLRLVRDFRSIRGRA